MWERTSDVALMFLLVLACSGAFWSPKSSAHGGLSMDSDVCKLRIGPFNMHFAGYQPKANGNTEFCEDIPATGNTIIVMDAIDSELRNIPIEVRLIEDTGDRSLDVGTADGSQLNSVTMLHLPSKIYETGSIPIEFNFTHAGKYVGLVTAGDKGQYTSRFPFSVGIEKTSYGIYVLVAGVILLGLGFYKYAGRARGMSRPQGEQG